MINGKQKNQQQKPQEPNRAKRLATKGVLVIIYSAIGWMSMAFISLGMYIGNPLIVFYGAAIFGISIAFYILRRRIAAKIRNAFRKNK